MWMLDGMLEVQRARHLPDLQADADDVEGAGEVDGAEGDVWIEVGVHAGEEDDVNYIGKLLKLAAVALPLASQTTKTTYFPPRKVNPPYLIRK